MADHFLNFILNSDCPELHRNEGEGVYVLGGIFEHKD